MVTRAGPGSDIFSLRSGSYALIPGDDNAVKPSREESLQSRPESRRSRTQPALESIGICDSQRQEVRRYLTSVASNWDPPAPVGWEVLDQNFLESGPMQAATICLILLNAVVIGLETDFPEKFAWDVVENIFLAFFSVELVIRMYCLGIQKFFAFHNNPDIAWNCFDFLLVAMGVLSILLHVFAGSTDILARNATLFRIIRLLRILRVLRIIRIVRFLKQLYLLAYGFIEGTMAVLWVTILASFMLYICAVILVRAYGKNGNNDDPYHDFFEEHFGSIPITMFALFELITAPDLAPYKAAMFANPPLVVFLVIFIVLGSFGINGLLVALINESILEKNQARIEADRIDREFKRKDLQQRCGELFDELDVHHNRVLPRDEIRQVTEQVALLLESFGVNFQRADLDQMFYVMDYSDTGIIERSEFIQGVVGLCEQIRPMSIMELHYQVSKCVAQMDRNETKIDGLAKGIDFYDEKLDKIEARLKSIANFLHLGSGAGETRHPRQAEGVSFALESRNSSKEPATVREESEFKSDGSTPMLNEPPSLDDANHSPSRADKGPFGEQVPLVQLLQTQQGLLEAMKAYSAQVDDMQQVSKQKLVEMTLQLQEANVRVLSALMAG